MKIGGSNLNLLALGLVVSSILVGCGDSGAAGNNGTPVPTPGGNNSAPPSTGGRKMPTAEGNKVDGDTIKIGVVTSI